MHSYVLNTKVELLYNPSLTSAIKVQGLQVQG